MVSVRILFAWLQHDRYGNPGPGNPYNDFDLALLRLQTPVTLTENYIVNPVCLPYGYGLDDFAGLDTCWATGFGDTKGNHGNRGPVSHQQTLIMNLLHQVQYITKGTVALS